jgi:acyl-CoA hydrolase
MQTETKQSRIIFPCHLNDHDTLFGGIALEWMDEVAYITAVRYTRKKMMTISVNNLQFHHPLKPGMVAEISGKIIGTGKVRLEVMVEIFAEDMYSCTTQKAVNALFTLVAVDEKMKAVRLE